MINSCYYLSLLDTGGLHLLSRQHCDCGKVETYLEGRRCISCDQGIYSLDEHGQRASGLDNMQWLPRLPDDDMGL